jgi:sugar phosphate isomerase/epimerase
MTMFSSRLGCSSISFRHLDLASALSTISGLGFEEIDLGALPGVCDHVPFVLDAAAVEQVTQTVRASGLRVRSVNGDIGDLNAELDDAARISRDTHLDSLLALAAGVGASALVLPCGAIDHDPIRTLDADLDVVAGELIHAAERASERGVGIWTESLHFHRLSWNLDRATLLADRLAGSDVRIVMDFSHIVASGGDPEDFVARFSDRIAHVHLRDAVAGNINLSIGRGAVDFAGGLRALAAAGYAGHFSLELETRDISHEERPAAAVDAARLISSYL